MDGVSFQVTTSGMEAALARLNRLSSLNKHELMEGLGRLGQMQTRHRLEVEHKTPAGVAWKKTTDGREALFVDGKHLWRSIDYVSGEDEARWGSGLVYARIHQLGGVIMPVNGKALVFSIGGAFEEAAIGMRPGSVKNSKALGAIFAKKVTMPARPYVGMSEANKLDMVLTAWDFIDKVLQ
jgi:phage gpG-like protein